MAHGISAAVGKLGALSADIIMGVVSPSHLPGLSLPAICQHLRKGPSSLRPAQGDLEEDLCNAGG